MNLRFYIDPARGVAHCQAHGVTDEEVRQAMLRPGEDRPARDGARSAIGRTQAGRLIRTIYIPDRNDDSCFVVTAYELTGKPLQAFRRRQRGTKR